MAVGSVRRFRGVAVGAAIAAVTVAGAALAPSAVAQPPEQAADPSAEQWAPAGSAPIKPGVVTDTAGASCTSNFIFTDGDRVFIGQAAHCAGTGQATETNGCDSGTLPVGTPVTLQANDGTERIGVLAYSAWVTMQETGETDENICQFNDFALVQIDPEDVADVNPSIPAFGGPTGVDDDGLPAGEQVFSYGNSPLRGGVMELSPKTGISAGDVGEGNGHEVFTFSPGVPGDSGSAFLDSEGQGVGVLSTLNIAPLPASNGIADLARAMEYARTVGGIEGLELVLGTEPFTPSPAGLPLSALATPAGPPIAG